jgi:Lipopolysaccharide export system permease LptF/LptG
MKPVICFIVLSLAFAFAIAWFPANTFLASREYDVNYKGWFWVMLFWTPKMLPWAILPAASVCAILFGNFWKGNHSLRKSMIAGGIGIFSIICLWMIFVSHKISLQMTVELYTQSKITFDLKKVEAGKFNSINKDVTFRFEKRDEGTGAFLGGTIIDKNQLKEAIVLNADTMFIEVDESEERLRVDARHGQASQMPGGYRKDLPRISKTVEFSRHKYFVPIETAGLSPYFYEMAQLTPRNMSMGMLWHEMKSAQSEYDSIANAPLVDPAIELEGEPFRLFSEEQLETNPVWEKRKEEGRKQHEKVLQKIKEDQLKRIEWHGQMFSNEFHSRISRPFWVLGTFPLAIALAFLIGLLFRESPSRLNHALAFGLTIVIQLVLYKLMSNLFSDPKAHGLLYNHWLPVGLMLVLGWGVWWVKRRVNVLMS